MNIIRCPDFRDYCLNFKKSVCFITLLVNILLIFILGVFLNEAQKDYQKLSVEFDNLAQTNLELCDINTTLLCTNEGLEIEIMKYKEENAELEKQITLHNFNNNQNNQNNQNNNVSCILNSSSSTVSSAHTYGSKKTYMYYTSITNKSSAQWKIQMKATTNQYGVRVVNEDGKEYVCIAIGTGWHYPVGTKVFVATTNGGFYAIIGDIKGDSATTADHLKGTDGSITEFIVDKNLNSYAKKMGNLNVIADYSGDVTNITKVG